MLKKCAKLLTFGSKKNNDSTVIIMHNSCFETSIHLLLAQIPENLVCKRKAQS